MHTEDAKRLKQVLGMCRIMHTGLQMAKAMQAHSRAQTVNTEESRGHSHEQRE